VTIKRPIITVAVSVRAGVSKYASCTMPQYVCYIMQIVFESKKIRPMPPSYIASTPGLNRQISQRKAGQCQATLKGGMLIPY